MTFRERLADWISGGALSYACDDAKFWEDSYNRTMRDWGDTVRFANGVVKSLTEIRDETSGIKSGTAQKIHRMAKEALGE